MPVYDTTVQSVTSRVVNKKAGGTTTIYEVIDSEGNKWATFKNTIANEANHLINQAVQIQGRVEQNGSYQNYYLDDIRALPTSSRPQTEERFAPVESARQAQPRMTTSNDPFDPSGDIPRPAPVPTEKDWAIARAVAVKVSAQLSDDAKSFWMNLDSLVAYLMLGLKPAEFEGAGNTLRSDPPERGQNQFISQEASDTFSGYAHTDQDIPF